jgi:citrate lyase beta subunit
MIETAKGVQNVDLIANLESVQTLVFGSNDLTKDLKARHTPSRY